MKELWTGRVEVLTPPTDCGDTRAFTNVVTWATDPPSFRDRVAVVIEKYGWTLIEVETCGPISECDRLGEEISEILDNAKFNTYACIYGRFHYYPSKPA